MPSDDEGNSRRTARKLPLRLKHADAITQSLHLPLSSRLHPSEDDGEVDVAAPSRTVPCNLSQSIFHFMAAGRTGIPMSSRFDDEGDDGDDDSADERDEAQRRRDDKGKGVALPLRETESVAQPAYRLDAIEERGDADDSANEDALCDMSSSGRAPFMSQILEAEAQMDPGTFTDSPMPEEHNVVTAGPTEKSRNVDLAKKLMEIFCLPEKEELIAEYPCWLLKSVLLQGYLYITRRHICFFAYLPKKIDSTTKSGFLSKRGKSAVKFTRYWFILKGDVLSYYADPSELYFVNGHIDLRYGISANLVESKDGKDPVAFTITTNERSYYFRADSASSAREWVKTLQKVIFRTHNEGDSVKISIPIGNVIEVEESTVLEFADTVKIKVYTNDGTYAVDEYFFSFFSFGTDAITALKKITEESTARNSRNQSGVTTPSGNDQDLKTASNSFTQDGVRATLSPTVRSPRASGEYRRSYDGSRLRTADKVATQPSELQRHSSDLSRSNEWKRKSRRTLSAESTDFSVAESFDDVASSRGDLNQSASKILSGSHLFHPRGEASPKRLSRPTTPSRKDVPHTVIHEAPGHGSPSSSRPDLASRQSTELSSSKDSQALHEMTKSGTYPLQKAAGWAGWVKKGSKKMGTLIASQPMGYLEKVSDMWTGGRKHFREPMGRVSDDTGDHEEGDGESVHERDERFRTRFGLPESERLVAVYFGYLHRVLPLYGKLYLGTRHLCFRSILPGTKTRMILPLKDIENIVKEKGFRFGYSGLVLTIRGHEEIFFEFGHAETRDDCAITLMQSTNSFRLLTESGMMSEAEKYEAEAAKEEHAILTAARQELKDNDPKLLTDLVSSQTSEAPPIVFDDPQGSILNFKPTEPMHITCLTIGTRGDVQPYIALCLGFMREGHKARIASHAEFKDWVESYGIEFAPVEGDPAVLMQLCVEYGMFTVEFLREASAKMRGWLDGLLESSWQACQGTDLLIESPSAMGGIHIAEALAIPYFRAFTMPWTRTRAYPHAFAVPERKMGGAYNYFTYVIIDNVFWKSTAGQINRWRQRTLNLPRTSLDKLAPHKVPFLYNFSKHVVAQPVDYSDWIHITGYWFLDTNKDWKPPADLAAFIKQARDDGKKLVYIGFGSVTVGDPKAMTNVVIESVLKADVRCVLSKGWSDRMHKKDASEPEVELPPQIFQIKSCPHDWLFAQMDAACHHGGAGTTGASLRAGIPTIIKPFFGDQFFFGNRVEDLGVGVCVRKMTTGLFSKALRTATHDERMIMKAQILGEEIRKEDGVDNAIQLIYRDLDYARSLIKHHPVGAGGDPTDDSEESWTFVGDDSDAEKMKTKNVGSGQI